MYQSVPTRLQFCYFPVNILGRFSGNSDTAMRELGGAKIFICFRISRLHFVCQQL